MDRKKKRTPRLRPSKRLTVLKQWTMMKIQKPSLKEVLATFGCTGTSPG